MIMYLYWNDLGKRIRYWKGFVRLGEVSYSTYLVHWPILATLNAFIPNDWSKMARAEVLLAAGAPITLLCSFLLYRFVEQPGIAFGRHLTRSGKEIEYVPVRSAKFARPEFVKELKREKL